MDELVKAALAKWPAVPDCFGWLALDARGNWYMRDDRVQALAPFPQAKGSRIEHTKLREFIERNYAADAQGRWFFQNGPQRVFVELEVAPWVWRLQQATANPSAEPLVHSHTGRQATVQSSWLDEQGRLFLGTAHGLGIVHSLDMEAAANAIEAEHWGPQTVTLLDLTQRFGHCLSPQGTKRAAQD